MRYLEVSQERANVLWDLGNKINIAVYQGVYGNDFVKEYTVRQSDITKLFLAWQVKEILKELPDNIHYTVKYYERVY